jgi:putative transposase
LMSNHIHLLSTPMVLNGLSKMMQSLAHHYARYFNDKYQHSGGMWGGRFKNSVINSDDYLLRCYLYIELNSVRAGIVQDPCEYRWSSYHENTGRLGNIIVTPHALFSLLGSNRICIRENYKALVAQGLSVEHVRVICKSSRRGGVIV